MKSAARILAVLAIAALSAFLGFALARQLGNDDPRSAPEAAAPAAPPPLAYERRPVFEPTAPVAAPSGPSAAGRWARANQEAIEALEAGQIERAVELFESCLEAVPEEPIFAHNLAEALARLAVRERERERPCAACLERLERASALAPEREDLALLLERWRREAQAEEGFWRESSLHFDLAYDGERTEILHGSHRILAGLEAAYTDLCLVFGTDPVGDGRPRIAVSLYRRDGFGALTGLGDWAGGAFDGSVRVPVEDLALEERELARVLRHELVHAFVREVGGPSVPGWLNEGLAQWLEADPAPTVARARARLKGAELFALERLEGSLAQWKEPEAIRRAYAQSLFLCDHLARRHGERLLVEMVAGCKGGVPPAETYRSATGDELELVLGDLAQEL